MTPRPILAAALAATLALPTLAAAESDPAHIRERLMDSNAAAAAVSGGIMKEQIPYLPVIGKAAIQTFAASAAAIGDFFPEGSAGDTDASPKIWEDPAGWQAAVAEFTAAAEAALAASGKDGPADAATFAAAVQPVLKTCQSCHETYRLKR